MHVVSARSFGLLAAISLVVVLVAAPGCATGGAGASTADAPDLASAGALPSNAGPSLDAAGAGDVAASNAAEAGSRADGGAFAGGDVAPFHVIGRVDERDAAGPRFGWSATELRARFSGAALAVVLRDTGASQYDVSVDGGAPTLLVVTGDARPYEVATGLPPGEHDVILTKRTETGAGVTQLLGFVGTLVPSPLRSGRRIELIGDSITCGYGVLGASAACPYSPSTQAEPLAWGAIAANQLAALHMVTAVSGIGMLRNFGGETSDTMPARYDRALADDASSVWNHHEFEPDVIVVDLGTNDFAGGKGDPGPSFQAAYTSFLATVRARHPQARIVAATSPMLSSDDRTKLRAYVEGAIAARLAAGDTSLSLVEIDEQSGVDGYGCDYHPNITTQKKMAARLVAHLKPLMAW